MPEFEVIEVPEQPALAIRETIAYPDIPARMGEFLGEIASLMGRKGIAFVGPPYTLYHSWGAGATDMEVGMPVPPGIEGEGRVRATIRPGGRVVTGLHVGPYDKISETYAAMEAWMKEHGHAPASSMWEIYLTDPQVEKDPAKYETRLYWPLA